MSHGSTTSTARPALMGQQAPAPPPLPPQQAQRRKAPPTFHFFAGLATGSLSAVLLQPADLLKTRVQQSRGSSVGATLKEILGRPGVVRSLWRGTLPSVIRTGFGSALYFASLNALRGALAGRGFGAAGDGAGGSTSRIDTGAGPDTTATQPIRVAQAAAATASSSSSSALPKLSNVGNLTTGALARAGAGLVMMPITVLKVRYESSMYGAYRSQSLLTAGRGIVAREGVRGLYAGYGATLVRDAPYAGLYVLFYERTKGMLGSIMQGQGDGDGGGGGGFRAAQVNFLAGCAAAATATAVTNPFDAIKTRIQLMPHKYRNMGHAAATMLREDGPRALFDGLGLRMARKAMSSALAWTIYEDLVRRAELHYNKATLHG